jgi:hypothetical protein
MEFNFMKKKKDNRGGKREGAGRPKTKEETKVRRIPVSLLPAVDDLIEDYRKSQSE